MKKTLFTLLCALAFSAKAGELQPFSIGSLAVIKVHYAGRPFMLTFWSLTCPHCARELQILGKLARTDKNLPLVIVSTDTPDDAQDIRAALKRFGLDHLNTWVFADAIPERLRRSVDPAWRGELPRSYLFDATHSNEAHSGMLDAGRLRQWFQTNRAAQ